MNPREVATFSAVDFEENKGEIAWVYVGAEEQVGEITVKLGEQVWQVPLNMRPEQRGGVSVTITGDEVVVRFKKEQS